MNVVSLRVLEDDLEVLNVTYRTPMNSDLLAAGVLRLLYQGPDVRQEVDIALYEISEIYRPLAHYLIQQSENNLILSLKDIERILGTNLPPSAYKHNAWWSNTDTHSQAKAWLSVGWRTRNIDLKTPSITFHRVEEMKLKGDGEMFHSPEPKQMTILSVGSPKVTPNGNRYLDCETSVGKVAVWGSSKNDTNIRALMTNNLPIEVIAMCIPGKHNHIYWVPETTSLFLAARTGVALQPTLQNSTDEQPF